MQRIGRFADPDSGLRIDRGADFDSTDASLKTSAFAAAMRLLTSRLWEMKRSEPARAPISYAESNLCAEGSSRAEVDWMLHGSRKASVNPASNDNPVLSACSLRFTLQ